MLKMPTGADARRGSGGAVTLHSFAKVEKDLLLGHWFSTA